MNNLQSLLSGLKITDEHLEQLKTEFNDSLSKTGFEKTLINIAWSNLPGLLTNQKIRLRKYKTHCRSCIITDSQVNEMASLLYSYWLKQQKQDEDKHYPLSFEELNKKDRKNFYELIYSIPLAFKQLGYELYREAEDAFINEALAEQLARSIHARFRKHMMDETSTDVYQGMYLVSGNKDTFEKEFNELPDDIKAANIDNAYHIPTKLLSIGYKMEKTDDDVPPLLKLSDHEIETMAMMEHDRWSWERRLNGWVYNKTRNNDLKQHNCLLPYDELPPYEQEKDRIMVRFIPALLVDIGYRAVKVSPELASEISYIGQQNGYVFEAETQIRNLQNLITRENDEIQSHFNNVFNKVNSIDELKQEIVSFQKYLSRQYLHSSLQRLETTNSLLKHIKGAFRSGQQVQRTFMPQSVELKAYFPESFILFKPQDIVSGDFYFISKQGDWIIYTDADCTGHGISGSILSGICYNYLHEATNTNQIIEPIEVLQFVMPRIRVLLKHAAAYNASGSEMELAVCAINTKTFQLKVASYGRPVYAFLNNEFTQLGKGAKTVETDIVDGFHVQQLSLNKGDTVYSFPDGYADQLGGPDGRKFMTKRFKQLLKEIQTLEMHEQCQVLNSEIEDWRKCEGKYECDFLEEDQTDDISIIGIKI